MASRQAIIEILRSNQQLFTAFERSIRNKDVVVLLGITKGGKSTLANYLMENTLYGIQVRRGIFKIVCDDPNGPTIGQGSLSCTSVPVVYHLSTGIAMVDAPGFKDNRGVEQEILNTIYNYQIKSARSIKFILVCDIADIINDNIGSFISSLNQLSKFVTNYQELAQSFAVIFTKDCYDYTQEEVITLFKDKILQQLELVANRELIEGFVRNKQVIGIFKMPQHEGEIIASDGLAVNINEAIDLCQAAPIDECQINVATSETLRNVVLEIVAEYTDRDLFQAATNRIIIPHMNYFNIEKYVFASYDEELENVKRELNVTNDNLELQIDINMSRINEIELSLINLNVPLNINEGLYSKVRLLLCLDNFGFLEEHYRSLIIRNYKWNLTQLRSRVTDLIDKIIREEEFRTINNIVFGVHGVGFAAAAAGAVYGIRNVLSAPRAAIAVGGEVALGSVASMAAGGVGLLVVGGVAASAYVRYKETYGRRYEARRDQGRE